MNQGQKVIRVKVEVLELVKQLGACRVMGYSRDNQAGLFPRECRNRRPGVADDAV